MALHIASEKMKRNYNQNKLTATTTPMNHGAQVERISQPQHASISRSDTSIPAEKNWTVSEMVNPDGSVTIRRSIVNSEGRRIIKEEELSSTKTCLIVKDEFDSEIIGRRNILPLKADQRLSKTNSDRTGYTYTNANANPPHITPSKRAAKKPHRTVRFDSESSASSTSSAEVRRNLMLVKQDILRVTADIHAGSSDVSTNPTHLEMQQAGLGRNNNNDHNIVNNKDSASSKPPPIKELTAGEERREDEPVLNFDAIWNEPPKVLPTNRYTSQAVIPECKTSLDRENSGSMLQCQQRHSTSLGKGSVLKTSGSGATRLSLSDPDPIYRIHPEDSILTPVTGSSRRDSRAENLKVLKLCDSRESLALPDMDNARDPVSRTRRSASRMPFRTNGTDADDEFQEASYDGSASTLSSFSRIVSQNVSKTLHSNTRSTGMQMDAISEGEKPNGWNSSGSTKLSLSPIRPRKNRGVYTEDELQHSSVDGTDTSRSSFSKMFGKNSLKKRVPPNKSRPQQEMVDAIYESDPQAPTITRPMPPKVWSERFDDHPDDESNALKMVRNFGMTVFKKSPTDKVGINVGVRGTRQGNRLVVSKISPTGLIFDSNVQLGDIVTSINGYNFVAKPDSLVALDIVRNSAEIIFSFQRLLALNPAMDDLSLPTLAQGPGPQTSNPDMPKTVSRESGSDDERLEYSAARAKSIITDCSTTVESDEQSPAEVSSEGPEESVTNSGEASRRSRVSEIPYLAASKVKERDFDEESYGASLDCYNASKTVTVTKSTPSQSIGISFLTDQTDWGALLIVSKISPSGLLAKTDLWVGDIILAINDVNFRDNPDAKHAAAVINDARDKLCIEFQRISGWKPALPPRQTQTTKVTETLWPDGRKIVRTETFNADKSKKVKIEEFVPPRRVDVPILRNNSDISALASIDVGDMRGLEAASFDDAFKRQDAKQRMLLSVENAEALDAGNPKYLARSDPGLKACSFDESFLRRKDDEQEPIQIVPTRTDRNMDAQTIMRPRTPESKTSASVFKATVGPKGTDTIVLTVTKNHPWHEVGISMGTVKGVLYVTRISPTSLFVGKPILPGDTILSINNISFRKDAATKDAFAAIVNAPSTVTVELKKTANQKHVLEADYSDEGASKRCGIFGLLGRGRSRANKSNRSRSLSSGPKGRNQSIPKSKQGEPSVTPDTSIEVEDFDPFYV